MDDNKKLPGDYRGLFCLNSSRSPRLAMATITLPMPVDESFQYHISFQENQVVD
jgi:hypothetical protein